MSTALKNIQLQSDGSVSLVSTPIVAKAAKLRARWTIKPDQDLSAMYGIGCFWSQERFEKRLRLVKNIKSFRDLTRSLTLIHPELRAKNAKKMPYRIALRKLYWEIVKLDSDYFAPAHAPRQAAHRLFREVNELAERRGLASPWTPRITAEEL